MTNRRQQYQKAPNVVWGMQLTSRSPDLHGRFKEPSPRCPIQELRDAIDLIVMFAMREGEQLKEEAVEPFGGPRQVEVSSFDLGGLRGYTIGLAALWLLADRAIEAGWRIAMQVLKERHAGSGISDQDGFGAVPGG
jgi:hypothetical protein